MSREIKFRAWDKNECRMIYSGTEQNDYPFSWMIHSDGIDIVEHDGTDWNYLKDIVFMQCTGLHDKNGKEIYDDDVLECGDRIVKVKWNNPCGTWDCDFVRYQGVKTSNGISNADWQYRANIIGNIHENPELLAR